MKKVNLFVRVILFGVVLTVGTLTALVIGETTGLALADLSGRAVKTIIDTNRSETLFATLEGQKRGIYRSDDYGRSWQIVSQGPAGNLNQLVVHPANKQILYAATSAGAASGYLWYSYDGGQNWQGYNLALPKSQLVGISVLEIDPTNPSLLYVGTEGQGLYRVQPEYDRLERIGDATMEQLYVKDVVLNPNDNQVYAVTTEGLFVINGNAWREIKNLPDTAVSLAIDPANPQILYAGTV